MSLKAFYLQKSYKLKRYAVHFGNKHLSNKLNSSAVSKKIQAWGKMSQRVG